MVNVYPKLKEYCQSQGYDFQVVDMRWGVRDEATADHMTSELCMRELKACQKLSTGPNFIVCFFDLLVILHYAPYCCILLKQKVVMVLPPFLCLSSNFFCSKFLILLRFCLTFLVTL